MANVSVEGILGREPGGREVRRLQERHVPRERSAGQGGGTGERRMPLLQTSGVGLRASGPEVT